MPRTSTLLACAVATILALGCHSASQSVVSVSLTASPPAPDVTTVTLMVDTVSRVFPTPNGLTASPVVFGVFVGKTGKLDVSAMTPATGGCFYSATGTVEVASAGSSPTVALALVHKCTDGGGGSGSGGVSASGGSPGTCGGGAAGTGGAGPGSGGAGGPGTGGAGIGGAGTGGAASGGAGAGGTGAGGSGSGAAGAAGNAGSSGNPPSLAHCTEYDHNAASNPCDLNMNPPVGNWAVRSVAFAPSAPLFVSGSEDGRVKVWNYSGRTLTEEGHVFGSFGFTVYVAFSPDGTYLAAGSRNIVKVWKVSDWSTAWQLTINNEDVYAMAFPDNQHIVIGTDAKNISWLTIGSPTFTSAVVPSVPYSLAASAASGATTLAVGMSSGDTQLLSVTTAGVFTPIKTIAATSDGTSASGMAFTADGQTLAIGSEDALIRFFKAPFAQQDGAALVVDVSMMNSISALAFSPSAKTLASGSYGGGLDLFDLPSRQSRAQNSSLMFSPTAVAFSPTGTTIGVGEFNCGKIAVCAD